jgi:hypothetical protein
MQQQHRIQIAFFFLYVLFFFYPPSRKGKRINGIWKWVGGREGDLLLTNPRPRLAPLSGTSRSLGINFFFFSRVRVMKVRSDIITYQLSYYHRPSPSCIIERVSCDDDACIMSKASHLFSSPSPSLACLPFHFHFPHIHDILFSGLIIIIIIFISVYPSLIVRGMDVVLGRRKKKKRKKNPFVFVLTNRNRREPRETIAHKQTNKTAAALVRKLVTVYQTP